MTNTRASPPSSPSSTSITLAANFFTTAAATTPSSPSSHHVVVGIRLHTDSASTTNHFSFLSISTLLQQTNATSSSLSSIHPPTIHHPSPTTTLTVQHLRAPHHLTSNHLSHSHFPPLAFSMWRASPMSSSRNSSSLIFHLPKASEQSLQTTATIRSINRRTVPLLARQHNATSPAPPPQFGPENTPHHTFTCVADTASHNLTLIPTLTHSHTHIHTYRSLSHSHPHPHLQPPYTPSTTAPSHDSRLTLPYLVFSCLPLPCPALPCLTIGQAHIHVQYNTIKQRINKRISTQPASQPASHRQAGRQTDGWMDGQLESRCNQTAGDQSYLVCVWRQNVFYRSGSHSYHVSR
uniref:Uncharacterized protein n=1 Tax=Echinococcus granulosus TaxID=6210 RepID=A0A068WWG3_ECHGR|nr:hypothetical protein EgrG_000063200 [Echinococcus granulosus]